MENSILSYIQKIPKVELHLHIEGSFEPELVFKIAQRNGLDVAVEYPSPKTSEASDVIKQFFTKAVSLGITPYQQEGGGVKAVFETPEQLARAYQFNNLQEFLDIYYAGMNVLQTEQDFYDLTAAYLNTCHQQNIVHTEIFFDPQGHTCRGVPFSTVINGIYRALQDGEKNFGISSGLIMCYLRHLSEQDALKTWQEAQPYLDKLVGVGLDSSESGHPPSKFQTVFNLARAAGKKVVAHAGEEGPPGYVWEALNLLQVDRVDHGNRALEDSELVQKLVHDRKILTVCPLSNLKLQVVPKITEHPLKKMLTLGLKATINSDDPAYFGGYLNENFEAMQQALELSLQDIYTLVDNAVEGSFASDTRKAELRRAVQKYHDAFTHHQAAGNKTDIKSAL